MLALLRWCLGLAPVKPEIGRGHAIAAVAEMEDAVALEASTE